MFYELLMIMFQFPMSIYTYHLCAYKSDTIKNFIFRLLYHLTRSCTSLFASASEARSFGHHGARKVARGLCRGVYEGCFSSRAAWVSSRLPLLSLSLCPCVPCELSCKRTVHPPSIERCTRAARKFR